MIGQSPNQAQKHLFLPALLDFINPRHELCLLAEKIDWQAFETAFASGEPVAFDVLMKCGGTICPWLASITFGGRDLRSVYLGGLRSSSIPVIYSPVAGLPMVHW